MCWRVRESLPEPHLELVRCRPKFRPVPEPHDRADRDADIELARLHRPDHGITVPLDLLTDGFRFEGLAYDHDISRSVTTERSSDEHDHGAAGRA